VTSSLHSLFNPQAADWFLSYFAMRHITSIHHRVKCKIISNGKYRFGGQLSRLTSR